MPGHEARTHIAGMMTPLRVSPPGRKEEEGERERRERREKRGSKDESLGVSQL